MNEEKKTNRYEFDCVAYAWTFSFCTRKEKAQLLHVLWDAWQWGAPKRKPRKQKGFKPKSINNL